MAALPSQPLVSVEEYLHGIYEPECEYLDGALEPKAMPDFKHSVLQGLLVALLVAQREKFGFRVCPELHVRVKPTRFRIPDISVLAGPPAGASYVETPPLFTIEIISPDDPWPKVVRTVKEHHEMGVPTIIVADPRSREVFIAGQDGLLRELAAPLVVSVEPPGAGALEIDFDQLFSQLD
jgi:Uma2 family endonuclease